MKRGVNCKALPPSWMRVTDFGVVVISYSLVSLFCLALLHLVWIQNIRVTARLWKMCPNAPHDDLQPFFFSLKFFDLSVSTEEFP